MLSNGTHLSVEKLCVRACVHAFLRACECVCVRKVGWVIVCLNVCLYIYVCLYACLHAYMQACMHAYMHACIHIIINVDFT